MGLGHSEARTGSDCSLTYFLLHHSSREEPRIHTGIERDRVGEDEIPEVLFRDQALLDQLIGFFYNFSHIRHIPVADVGAEENTETRPEGVHSRVKCPGSDGVVRLTAKVKVGNE